MGIKFTQSQAKFARRSFSNVTWPPHQVRWPEDWEECELPHQHPDKGATKKESYTPLFSLNCLQYAQVQIHGHALELVQLYMIDLCFNDGMVSESFSVMQCFGFVRTERCLDVQPGSTLSTASLQVWCEPQLFWATDFMRGVPWTFTLSAQLKSISSIATHALEGANSVPHSLGVSKQNCAPVRLDLFVLLQPAPYFACPPLCPNNCLSHALQHHCILAGVRIICIRHNRSIMYIYIYIYNNAI